MRKQPARELIHFQHKTKYLLGRKIHSGGIPPAALFQLQNHPDKLVKIVSCCCVEERDQNLALIRYLKKKDNPAIVKIHNVGSCSFQRECDRLCEHCDEMDGRHYYYYYVMEKLRLNTRKVKPWLSVIDKAIGRDNLYGIGSELYIPEPETIISPVQAFLNHFKQLKLQYTDTHQWNIMYDPQGNWKLVDLEAIDWC